MLTDTLWASSNFRLSNPLNRHLAAMNSALQRTACLQSTCLQSTCQIPRSAASNSRKYRSVRVYAVSYDPENLFNGTAPREGIIERRLMQKQMQTDKEFAKAVSMAADEDKKKVLLRRQSRTPPTDNYGLIEYLLNTQAEDIEFEAARCRPQLTAEFFKQLDTLIGNERFAAKPDQERLAELETLRQYLEEATEAIDKAVASNISAVERMKKLLTSQDKKQCILDMAAANEIDVALLDLLQQNIDAAKAAGQADAAQFMEKVKQATAKFLVSSA